jgi:hypothetical protein
MRFFFDTSEIEKERAILNGAGPRFLDNLEKELFRIGEKGVSIAKTFRRGGTTATKTAVRTGRLLGAYGQRIKREGATFTQDIGAIRPSDSGQVPLHARMQEGIDAQGNTFEMMIIRAKRAPFLVFPIRAGGGMAKKNIRGWVKTKQVIFRPRPSLPTVKEQVTPLIEKAPGNAFVKAVQGAP